MSSCLEIGCTLPEIAGKSKLSGSDFAGRSAPAMTRSQSPEKSDSGAGVGPADKTPGIGAAAGITDIQCRQGRCIFHTFDHPRPHGWTVVGCVAEVVEIVEEVVDIVAVDIVVCSCRVSRRLCKPS